MARITGVNTLSDLIDRLIVEVNRLSYFEQAKRKEQLSDKPDPNLIMKLDHLSRTSCELRSMLKIEINECLKEIVETGKYSPLKEPRSFTPPKITVADILEEMCKQRSELNFQLSKCLEDTLKS